MIDERPEQVNFRNFRGWDAHRTSLFPEAASAPDAVPSGLLPDALNLRFSRDGRAFWHRNQLRIAKPTGKVPIALTEFVSNTHNQLIFFASDGHMYYLGECVWTAAPTQFGYGYELFHSLSWVDGGGSLPTAGRFGFASVRNRLLFCSGVSTGFAQGLATKMWTGAAPLKDVGLVPPATAPTGVAHTGTGDALIPGTYSYRVAFGSADFKSMLGPAVEVVVEEGKATGIVSMLNTTTRVLDGDTITIGSQMYKFVDPDLHELHPNDIPIDENADAFTAMQITWSTLSNAIREGMTQYSGGTWGTIPNHTPAHPDAWSRLHAGPGEPVHIHVDAREAGEDGNAITLAESTSGVRMTVSGATLSTGAEMRHVDLSAIPTGPSGTTVREVYRSYAEPTTDATPGESYKHLATINDNTTATYADNTPQYDLGEPQPFDYAMPPRGDHMVAHRDRVFMAGICRTSQSYGTVRTIAASPTGAVRSSNVVTITVTAAHGLNVGDPVTIAGVTDASFNGTFNVATVPSTTSFTYAQTGTNGASGGGTATYGVYCDDLENLVFYSGLDEPYYWPAENQIAVGGSSAILGLLSFAEELLIFKAEGVWVLRGYGEGDLRLDPIVGAPGCLSGHAASSPFGVAWAAPDGWYLYNGSTVRRIIGYQEHTAATGEQEGLTPPPTYPDNESIPAVACHDGRFYLATKDYLYCWRPEEDTWEVCHYDTTRVGVHAFSHSPAQSHVLAYMTWGAFVAGDDEITVLDSTYSVDSPPTGRYTNDPGTEDDEFLGEVRIELPPVVAPAGQLINPLELWVYGSWTPPEDPDDDLHLYIHNEATGAWTDMGVVTQNARLGIPPGYAARRLRLLLAGAQCAYFTLNELGLIHQRRAARG